MARGVLCLAAIMKRIFLGLSLVASACASPGDPASDCLPGDIDCAAPSSGGGKADGFDYKNDPTRMSQHLTYELAKLPKKGFRDTPVWKDTYPEAVGKAESIWADTYWPTSRRLAQQPLAGRRA